MPYALQLPVSDTLVMLPDCWADVTLAQADALAAATDLYDALAILCGVSPAEVMHWPADALSADLQDALAFLELPAPDFAAYPVPAQLVLPDSLHRYGWRPLPVPQDLSARTFGQSADLAAVLSDESLSAYQQHARALAIYLYPLYYRCPYDSDQVEAFAEQVCSQLTLREALPVTAFFFGSTKPSGKHTRPKSAAFRSRLRSARQAWKSWWSSGTWWPSWMHSVVEIKLVGRISSASRGRKST